MRLKRCKNIVAASLRNMRYNLWLTGWKIDIEWRRIGGSALGECKADPRYKRATISLDHDLHRSKAEFLFTLRHELLHIVHAEFETHRQSAYKATGPGTIDEVLDVSWFRAAEDTVNKMERIMDLHGLTPKKLSKERVK